MPQGMLSTQDLKCTVRGWRNAVGEHLLGGRWDFLASSVPYAPTYKGGKVLVSYSSDTFSINPSIYYC